ncbi:MAG: type II toxin-antitoxin system RatA family toxin [Gammaproteobacteria bacterium]|nr:type II toxin-antitoxin system RatA family toxin [Gammaproteobacteria bacterium]
MIEYHKVVNVPYHSSQMYALVTDIARYQDFLAWCNHSLVLENRQGWVLAELGIHYNGFSVRFQTHNTYIANQQVEIKLHKNSGILKDLKSTWRFIQNQTGCTVKFEIHIVVGLVFSLPLKKILTYIASSLVEDFLLRAQHIYGQNYLSTQSRATPSTGI